MATSTDRLLDELPWHAGLPPHVTSEQALEAVMSTLIERLTPGEAHALWLGMPRALRAILENAVEQREGKPVARLDDASFLDRVANRLGVTPAHAEVLCAAVFAAVRAELPPKLVRDVTRQLPRDLQRLWLAPMPSRPVPYQTMLAARLSLEAEIEESTPLPPDVTGARAFAAVMCAFSERLSGGTARDVLLGLPQPMRALVEACVLHRGEPASAMNRDQLLRRIAQHLTTSVEVAETITRAVFAAVRRSIPEKEVRDVASQLPADLRDLWLSQAQRH